MDGLRIHFYFSFSVLCVIVFLQAIFPSGDNPNEVFVDLPLSLHDYSFDLEEVYKPKIDKLVLIVIDALRHDFVIEENMPFLVSEYKKKGCFSSIKVETPTVTLPRIKALTTGNVPQFIDVVFNLVSTESQKNSFLHNFKAASKRIVFFGDDTWLKLYPDVFQRYEGVSSFYVNDFDTVDSNVTRNVVEELKNQDWDMMVLHYLGLDHIGHVHGPYSSLIRPKLKEMDQIVKTIQKSMETRPGVTLILITGDHGMKDSGGHGGATYSETVVPLIAIGLKCHNGTGFQTDIPTTISALLALPLPPNSVGRVLNNLLSSSSLDELLYALHYNSLVLDLRLSENFLSALHKNATSFHYQYLKSKNLTVGILAEKAYRNYLLKASQELIKSSVKQDVTLLVITITLMFFMLFLIFSNFLRASKWKTIKLETLLVSLMCTIHPFCLSSSSFIEEEHQVYYFFWNTLLALKMYLALRNVGEFFEWFGLFVMIRFIKTINQTGDRWAHLPDLSQWLLREEHFIYFACFHAASMILVWCCLIKFFKNAIEPFISGYFVVVIFAFQNYFIQNSSFGKFIWVNILIYFMGSLIARRSLKDLVSVTWILISIFLLRKYNVILVPACVVMNHVLCKYCKKCNPLTVYHVWMGNVLYFCQGHSNSLANIDIAMGYIGLEKYNPFLVAVQVFVHSYSLQILSCILLMRKCSTEAISTIWSIKILYQLLILCTVCSITLLQRHHLFIWSVFAPKLLIESSHTITLLIQIILFYLVVYIGKLNKLYK